MVGAGLTDKRAWLELIAMVIMYIRRQCRSVVAVRKRGRTDHRRDAGSRDAGWSLYVSGEEVQMHGGIVRTAFGGLAAVRCLSMRQCATWSS